MAVIYWLSLSLILFALFGYGLLWTALARLMPPRQRPKAVRQKATVLIAARNEAADIGDKIRSILSQDVTHALDILVVSDGSEDGTLEVAHRAAGGDSRLRTLALDTHSGKAAALNAGLARIAPDRIVVFSDANSVLGKGALEQLLAPFADPAVGASVGQLDIPARGGVLARAERLFWRYDNALKQAEDRVAGVISAQGTLYAVRRKLVPVVPADMADDLVISLAVVHRGYRLAFAKGAVARETVTGRVGGEFGRRVRSTERGWRGLMQYRHLMNPARTGLYAVQLICHKLLRRLVAFLLPLLLIANLALAGQGLFYAATFLAQSAVYLTALAALTTPLGRKLPGASIAVFFVVGHAAIVLAILRYFAGVRSTKWAPVR